MDAFLGWILAGDVAFAVARLALGLIGALVLVSQLVLAGYAVPKVVRLRTKLLIACGAGAGAGALHAAVVGSLASGLMFAALACLLLIALLTSQAGVSRRRHQSLSPGSDVSHTRAWLRGVVEHAYDLREAVSDWGDMPVATDGKDAKGAGDGETKS